MTLIDLLFNFALRDKIIIYSRKKSMKKVVFLFTLILLIVSCEKTRTSDYDVPSWLQKRINYDEEIIKSNPQSGLDIAAWVRFDYKGKYYYEYVNLLSSAGPKIYKNDGTEFIYTETNFFGYQTEKCCRYYVWKGPTYFEIYD